MSSTDFWVRTLISGQRALAPEAHLLRVEEDGLKPQKREGVSLQRRQSPVSQTPAFETSLK